MYITAAAIDIGLLLNTKNKAKDWFLG